MNLNELKTEVIFVRVNKLDHDRIVKAAVADGRTVANWARGVLFAELASVPRIAKRSKRSAKKGRAK